MNASSTRFSVYSDSQAAIRSLSGFVNNSRIVRECRRCLDLLFGRFSSVSLVLAPGHNNIPGNCRADELARATELLQKASSNELGIALVSVKLDIERKFFCNANRSWVNKESCSTERLTWPLMDRRHTNQLLGLGRDVKSTTVTLQVIALWEYQRKIESSG